MVVAVRALSILLVLVLAVLSGRRTDASGSFPNDPRFPDQWALHNTGQNGGKPGADLHVAQAWNISHCSPDVTIAILDSGIDSHHPDLSPKLVSGAAFYPGVTSTEDDLGHGTQVAGVAAAATNNGEGMAGICPQGKLMPVKVVSAAGHTNDPMVGQAIKWAVDHGARVVSMSFWTDDVPEMRDGVAYAYAHNVVVVAAYGGMPYPADYPHVLAVGGSDNQDRPQSDQSQLSHDYVLAPDVGIITTSQGGGYDTFCACVSIAAPEVAGVAALLLSVDPELTTDQVISAIERGADPVPGQTGFNAIDGWGRVNAYRSLKIVQRTMPLKVRAMLKLRTVPHGQKETITVRALAGASVAVRVTYGRGRTSFNGAVGASGVYRHSWKTPGRSGDASIVVSVKDVNHRSAKTSLRFTIR